jgi:cell division protein FtsZ
MRDTGSALMGIGTASGENRAVEAAKQAISSPLLELSIDGAHGILFTISGGSDLAMSEVSEAAKIITNSAADDAKVIFGAIIDESMAGSMRVTVVATGFDDRRPSTMLKEEESANTGYAGGKYISSNFVRKTQRENEDEEKKFKQFTQKTNPLFTPMGGNFSQQTAAKEEKAKESEDDKLEIPAFIRKKMGV